MHSRHRLHQKVPIIVFVRGPVVFSCDVAMLLHCVFVVLQPERFGTEQTCFLVDGGPLVKGISRLSFSLRANKFYFVFLADQTVDVS